MGSKTPHPCKRTRGLGSQEIDRSSSESLCGIEYVYVGRPLTGWGDAFFIGARCGGPTPVFRDVGRECA